jgi:hypothetical protein
VLFRDGLWLLSKNKYETNYISETVGRGHGRRGRIEYSFRAGNFNYNHNYGGTTGVSESTTSTSTLNGSGTITAYTPGSDYIMFRTESSTTPVRYYYTKKTVLVDPEGRTVEWSALKPDMPVTYTYTKEGDRMVVTKVTLAKPLSSYETKETTTTTTKP